MIVYLLWNFWCYWFGLLWNLFLFACDSSIKIFLRVCALAFVGFLFYITNAFLYELNLMVLFTNPSARAGYDTRSIFKRSLTGFNSEFSFSYTSCLTKAEEPSLSYYLPKAGRRIIGFIPFPRVLVLCEMQSVSFRIWTRVAVFISYDDNDYTTGTSILNLMVTHQ